MEEHGPTRMEKQQEFSRNIKEYLEGKIEKKELGCRIQEVLGMSQGPACALRRKILSETEKDTS